MARNAGAAQPRSPFELVEKSEIVLALNTSLNPTATTLLEEIQRRHPYDYDGGLLPSSQWWGTCLERPRSLVCASKAPGRLSMSEVTHTAVLLVAVISVGVTQLL